MHCLIPETDMLNVNALTKFVKLLYEQEKEVVNLFPADLAIWNHCAAGRCYIVACLRTLIPIGRYCPTNTIQANPYKSRGFGYPVDPSV